MYKIFELQMKCNICSCDAEFITNLQVNPTINFW